MADINSLIRSGKAKMYRRAYIKRRSQTTGAFEDEWQEITDDVKKWGKLKTSVDDERYGILRLANARIQVSNDSGRYNPETDPNSLWFGFAAQQRSLLKIEAGYIHQTQTAGGVWDNTELPGNAQWDISKWDSGIEWDSEATTFVGLIAGDIPLNDSNNVTLNIKPLTEVFRQYMGNDILGLTSTGVTASQFMELLRDQTDGSGGFVFRPFFNNTSGTFNIASTTEVYSNLNTSTAKDIREKTVWSIMQRLAEAENHIVFVDNDGTFQFQPRDFRTGTAFEFYGAGLKDRTYGNTIKKITEFGQKFTKFYSRVAVKFVDSDTNTSFAVVESQLRNEGGNIAWYYGKRTKSVENVWIPSTATAQTLAQNIFNDVSSVPNEIKFTSSFVPVVNALDKIKLTYDSESFQSDNLWDLNDWADTAGAADTGRELVWNKLDGNAILLQDDEYRINSVEQDLDNFTTVIQARET